LHNPDVITIDQIKTAADFGVSNSFSDWINDRRNRRTIPHKLERCGYVAVSNSDRKDGLWSIPDKEGAGSQRQMIYARRGLSISQQCGAAAALVKGLR
jgi:hypothetical protein